MSFTPTEGNVNMSNPDTPTTTNDTNPTPNPEKEKEKGQFGCINEEVLGLLKDRNGDVRTAVVEELVKEKLDQRKKLSSRAFCLVRDLRSKIQKIKGTQVFDDKGGVIQEGFTKDQIGERKRCFENIAALEAGMKKGFDEAEYGPLEKAVGKAEKTVKGEKDDTNDNA